jgi:hypothetical protein
MFAISGKGIRMKYLKQEVMIARECIDQSLIPITESFIRKQYNVPEKCDNCYAVIYSDALKLVFSSQQIQSNLVILHLYNKVIKILNPDYNLKEVFNET